MSKHGLAGFWETRKRKRYQRNRLRMMTKGGKHTREWFN